MQWAGALRRELSARNQEIVITSGSVHELTTGETPSAIFGRSESRQHGNFHPASYRNICANPAWARRLTKVHTGSRKALPMGAWRWMELDCANSSDALLMNIFCYRRTVANHALSSMLGVAPGLAPEFGFRPRIPLRSGEDRRYRDRHETWRPHGGSQTDGNELSNGPSGNDRAVSRRG